MSDRWKPQLIAFPYDTGIGIVHSNREALSLLDRHMEECEFRKVGAGDWKAVENGPSVRYGHRGLEICSMTREGYDPSDKHLLCSCGLRICGC